MRVSDEEQRLLPTSMALLIWQRTTGSNNLVVTPVPDTKTVGYPSKMFGDLPQKGTAPLASLVPFLLNPKTDEWLN